MIGIDLVHIPEFITQLTHGGETFLHKAFNDTDLHDRDPIHLAGLWAAKEAVTKAAAIEPGRWRDISLGNPPSRTAYVDGLLFEISISHHGEYAVAVASGKDQ